MLSQLVDLNIPAHGVFKYFILTEVSGEPHEGGRVVVARPMSFGSAEPCARPVAALRVRGLEEKLVCSCTEQEKPSLSSFIFNTPLSQYNVCIYLDKTFAGLF